MDTNPSYPAVNFIVRYGPSTSLFVPLGMLAAWVAICVFYGLPAWTIAIAAFVAVILFGFLRSYVELVQIISETLLPR